ncbi:hypothetical protein FSP39_018982 [Pinctada imbricata]|uniref:EGF-like domain-containing protein n=1 Tax=Pinctada imbricata TaxID=66713 RepID=A0AA89BUI8_PINIB|nr:hypothetical protein FSP39_018982 [Pinctada imbricata]
MFSFSSFLGGVKCIYCASGCDNITGTCQKCIDGFYGSKCELACERSCRNCDKNTGVCTTCLDGWRGEDCSLPCNENCHLCDKDSGRCTLCRERRWGDSCQSFCTSNCHACNATNGDCIVCSLGFFGQNCEKQCGNCKRNICERTTGACVYDCNEGWHGPQCNRPCLNNCLMCEKQTGECIMCKGRLWGESCTLNCKENCDFCNITTGECVECKVGYYGKTCQEKCGNCQQEACDKDTGQCLYQCKDGYFGLKCDNKCLENCTRCSFRDSCLVCKPGLTGETCDIQCPSICQSCHVDELTNKVMCSQCKAEKRLPERNCTCSDKKCLRFNTEQPGFGRLCEECESGTGWFWHQGTCCPCLNCKGGIEQCAHNGTCLQGCKPGFYPKNEGCNLDCDIPNCVWCEPFFSYGKVCVGCEDGYYPSGGACAKCNQNCKNGLCNNKTGECLDGCVPGWYDNRCDTRCDYRRCDACDEKLGYCSLCKAGYWGKNCENKCSDKCIRCNQDTGECLQCFGNFFGPNCTGSCNNCIDEKCNKVDGQCQLGCKPGYYGPKCNNACQSGCAVCENGTSCSTCTQGLSYKNGKCVQDCVNCTDVQCDINGICQKGCVSGHFGPKCQGMCSSGCDLCTKGSTCDVCLSTHKMNNGVCISNCEKCVNSTCDNEGKCSHGCIGGWFGEDCNRECMEGCGKCTQADVCTDCKTNYKLIDSSCVRHCPNCLLGHCNSNFECVLGCTLRWFGLKCDKKCSDGCLTCYHEKECRRCANRMTLSEGFCFAACENCKFKECTSNEYCVNGCIDGWYDGKCNKRCSEGCVSCASFGECSSCQKGYDLIDSKCLKKCINCLEESCDKDGICNLGCKDGWYGFLCHSKCSNECKTCHDGQGWICSSCNDGSYGLQCEKSCPSTCVSCQVDKTTKKLTCNSCKRGYSVPEKDCSCTNTKCVTFASSSTDNKKCSVCTEGWYPNKEGFCCPCRNCAGGNNVCNGTSTCSNGCVPGWISPKTGCDVKCDVDGCTECISNEKEQIQCKNCQDGYYLESSNKCTPCSTHCAGKEHLCDRLTGKCLEGCEPGWKGDRCTAISRKKTTIHRVISPQGSVIMGVSTDGEVMSVETSVASTALITRVTDSQGNVPRVVTKVGREKCARTKALIVLPSIGLIAGGVTAAIVFIFMMTFLIFFIYKCRTKKKERENSSEAVRCPNTAHVNHGMLMDSVM